MRSFDKISAAVACHAGHPVSQLLFLAACVAWIVVVGDVDLLTLILSIMAISLTQMVQNSGSLTHSL
jgi:low affinity Fe/Cu permease